MIRFFRDLLSSLYSRPFYPTLIRHRRGIGLGFFLVILLIDIFFFGIRSFGPTVFEADHLARVVERFPDMRLTKGQLAIDGRSIFREPIFPEAPAAATFDPMGQPPQLVVDPSFNLSNQKATVDYLLAEHIDVLLASDGIAILGTPKHPLSTFSFAKLQDRALNHDTWLKLAWWLRTLYWPGTMVFAFPWMFAVVTVSVFGFACIAKLLSLFIEPSVSFGSMLRLAAATGVPATLLAELIWPTMIIKFMFWIGYIVFAFAALRTAPPEAVGTASVSPAPDGD